MLSLNGINYEVLLEINFKKMLILPLFAHKTYNLSKLYHFEIFFSHRNILTEPIKSLDYFN